MSAILLYISTTLYRSNQCKKKGVITIWII
nr:MAG TPA: hypothetical protein [Caudoviricetes sp.]